jgi:RNA polymerase sigma factor (TIGR02999 family)
MESEVTRLLVEWRQGRREALDELTPIVYRELHRLAGGYMRRQGAGHPLQPTALVNEAYVRLLGAETPDWQNRAHFMAAAARIMRQILVDFARRKSAAKRDFGRQVTLDDHVAGTEGARVEVILLNDALEKLAQADERKARVIELRYFGGLSLEETAEAMGLTVPTVRRDAALAQAWLREAMDAGAGR